MQDNNIKKLWHTNRKCFIEEFSILQTINSEGNYEHTYFEYNHKTQELERLSTCQVEEVKCSGLRDKNGKLIYKGDICEYNFEDIGKQRAIIIFNNKLAGFIAKPITNFQYTELNSCGVIGNVYENKELLG